MKSINQGIFIIFASVLAVSSAQASSCGLFFKHGNISSKLPFKIRIALWKKGYHFVNNFENASGVFRINAVCAGQKCTAWGSLDGASGVTKFNGHVDDGKIFKAMLIAVKKAPVCPSVN